MDENVENISLEGLTVGSVAQNLESDIVSHNASLNGFTLSTKTSLETINQLEYDKDSENFVFLESADLVNSERSKNEINKNTGYVVIGKDTADNDIRVVLFSEDGYQTDEEIETENLINYKNRLQNYFQFVYLDNGEIDTSKFDGEIHEINGSIISIAEKIRDLSFGFYGGETEFDGIADIRGDYTSANLNYIYFSDDYLPKNYFNKIGIYTHRESDHNDFVNKYNGLNNGVKVFYAHIFKSNTKFSSTLNVDDWNAMGWELLCSSTNSVDLCVADTYAIFNFDEYIKIEAGCSILIGFSISRDSLPSLAWDSGSYVPVRFNVSSLSWGSSLPMKAGYFFFGMTGFYKTNYCPKIFFYEKEMAEYTKHTHEEYLKKEDYFVQEKIFCEEMPTALKSGIVYDFGYCEFAYSDGVYDFSSLRFDEKYNINKVAQCEIRMRFPSDRANKQVNVPFGWVDENGGTKPIELTSSNVGKNLWFTAKIYNSSADETVQYVILKQTAIL